jgi:hypothetical protein
MVFFEGLRVFLALEPTEVPGDLGLQAFESFLEWRAERGLVRLNLIKTSIICFLASLVTLGVGKPPCFIPSLLTRFDLVFLFRLL